MHQFYGRLEKCVLSAGKPYVRKIPRLGGGVFWVWGGGVPILFLWVRGFSDLKHLRWSFVQILVHIFALYVGCGGHSRVSEKLGKEHQLKLLVQTCARMGPNVYPSCYLAFMWSCVLLLPWAEGSFLRLIGVAQTPKIYGIDLLFHYIWPICVYSLACLGGPIWPIGFAPISAVAFGQQTALSTVTYISHCFALDEKLRNSTKCLCDLHSA